MTSTSATDGIADTDFQARSRLLSAMSECVARLGYRATTVADVVRVARMSRRSFYEHFTDKSACFVAVLRGANDEMIDAVADAVDASSPWTDQVRQAVTAYVELSEARPELTLSWIRELPALGEPAQELKTEAMDAWISLFVVITSTPSVAADGIEPVSRITAIMIWGGIRELTADSVENGTPLSAIIEPTTQACIALIAGNTAR
ncbi:TetR/AcrR family transcriptional regulator [Gordonia liuliyuniae]|uniref:TetR/AcrR family transcriptional regulator n=1 Tax=Gordonia liuliyuniae TaxID=2911517 RepID=A0ABS9IX40_9ACTN|nr:TetR/AcrR family transcriptional regulator [Gordonia liuliyuniae]MCF8590128.1 TetR/AcrR family transcriptional regulator [Gordonia liuliyuniae]